MVMGGGSIPNIGDTRNKEPAMKIDVDINYWSFEKHKQMLFNSCFHGKYVSHAVDKMYLSSLKRDILQMGQAATMYI